MEDDRAVNASDDIDVSKNCPFFAFAVSGSPLSVLSHSILSHSLSMCLTPSHYSCRSDCI